jgi:hypothetical protein
MFIEDYSSPIESSGKTVIEQISIFKRSESTKMGIRHSFVH